MHHLGRADAPGERAEAAVGGGVAVAADQRASGQRDSELRRDHMDDTLTRIVDVVELKPELAAVVAQGVDTFAPRRVRLPRAPRQRRDDMVDHGKVEVEIADTAAAPVMPSKAWRLVPSWMR